MDYREQSKRIILAHQDEMGAFVASPAFEAYRYSWLRDGTFIAYSLDVSGEQAAAHRFYSWCVATVEHYREKASHVIERSVRGEEIPRSMLLHTRYTLDGLEVYTEWGTHQLDGYGALLWGMAEHIRRWNDETSLQTWKPTIELLVDYLRPLWSMPNFDCWEEYGDEVHPSTIAAIYGGLAAVKPWMDHGRQVLIEATLQHIQTYLQQEAIYEGRYVKFIGSQEIDTSLLWLHLPYQVVDPRSKIMQQTVRVIEERLCFDRGVHRYPQDVYYGGGQWVLLSAWLGWHYAELGQRDKAKQQLEWVRQQFNRHGHLPEQTTGHLLAPEQYSVWLDRSGAPPCPLLWSHAMHLVLEHKIERGS